MEKVKKDVSSTMALFKERELVFKSFARWIFSELEQSEQSEQSNSDDEYTSWWIYFAKIK